MISYEILPGEHADKFVIDPTSGAVTPSSPLDYESLPASINGQLELIIMAIDEGEPPLNNTVILAITVEVLVFVTIKKIMYAK